MKSPNSKIKKKKITKLTFLDKFAFLSLVVTLVVALFIFVIKNIIRDDEVKPDSENGNESEDETEENE